MPALDSDLVPFCSRSQIIEVVVAESDLDILAQLQSVEDVFVSDVVPTLRLR